MIDELFSLARRQTDTINEVAVMKIRIVATICEQIGPDDYRTIPVVVDVGLDQTMRDAVDSLARTLRGHWPGAKKPPGAFTGHLIVDFRPTGGER